MPIRFTAGFSEETCQERREWRNIFQILKQTVSLSTQKNISSKASNVATKGKVFENEMKYFQSRQKLKDISAIKPALGTQKHAVDRTKNEASHTQQ